MFRTKRGIGVARWLLSAGLAALAVIGLSVAPLASKAGAHRRLAPSALWRVVHDLCVPDRQLTGMSAPCLAVDLAGGVAVIKDPAHKTQILLVPTARITGIEDRALLAPAAPNYWRAAWRAKSLFQRRMPHKIPPPDLAIAVNSRFGRTQNQLHFHIDCVRPRVRDQLAAGQSAIGQRWSTFPSPLGWLRYRVMRLRGAQLDGSNLFALLAADRGAASHMDQETLVLIGARFTDGSSGYYLLSHRADLAHDDLASGEALLDHSCAVLRSP